MNPHSIRETFYQIGGICEMDQNPKVSIVIPFYNCPFINQALDSALNQTYKHIEIIVVDDGSTKYSEKIEPYLSRIRYLKKENGGTATALNLGIMNATGEYFTWLSSDDLYDSLKVERQLAFMMERKAEISYGNYVLIDSNNQVISGPAGIGLSNRLQFLKKMQKGCIINGCTVMLKLKLFEDVGLFCPLLSYTHDYDLWIKLIEKYDFLYLDEPLVKRRIHQGMGTKKYEKQINQEIIFVQKKHAEKLEELIRREELL
jgi:glycosyltransferase involved in cell wall biosynthesis